MRDIASEMNVFFRVESNDVQNQAQVNTRLLSMNREQLRYTVSRFGLFPISEYLVTTPVKIDKNMVVGFARYLDVYLLEMSGGKRSELIKLGVKIMGREPKAFSNRLIRLEIVDYIINFHSDFFSLRQTLTLYY